MLTFGSTKHSHRHCSSLVVLDQSSSSPTDHQVLLPLRLQARRQHLAEQQRLMMMMTCTTSHLTLEATSVFSICFLLKLVSVINSACPLFILLLLTGSLHWLGHCRDHCQGSFLQCTCSKSVYHYNAVQCSSHIRPHESHGQIDLCVCL